MATKQTYLSLSTSRKTLCKFIFVFLNLQHLQVAAMVMLTSRLTERGRWEGSERQESM